MKKTLCIVLLASVLLVSLAVVAGAQMSGQPGQSQAGYGQQPQYGSSLAMASSRPPDSRSTASSPATASNLATASSLAVRSSSTYRLHRRSRWQTASTATPTVRPSWRAGSEVLAGQRQRLREREPGQHRIAGRQADEVCEPLRDRRDDGQPDLHGRRHLLPD